WSCGCGRSRYWRSAWRGRCTWCWCYGWSSCWSWRWGRCQIRCAVNIETVAAVIDAVIEHKITISECTGAVVGGIQTSPRTVKSSRPLQRDQIVSEHLFLADDPKNIVRQCRCHATCERSRNG